MLADAATGVYNTAADLVAGKGNGYRFAPSSYVLGNHLTRAGLPEPENSTERIAQDGASAMAGAGAFNTAGKLTSAATAPLVRALSKSATSRPLLSTVSAATGGTAGGTARESGQGPGVQLAAALLGGAAPIALAEGVPLALGRVLRGNATANSMLDTAESFSSVGATPTVGQLTESGPARWLEASLSKIPGGASPLVARAEDTAAKVAGKIGRLADDLAPSADATAAGRAIQQGVKGDDPRAFLNLFKAQQGKLYDALDQRMPAGSMVDLTKTREALAALNSDIEGAKALSQWFKNAKIQGLESALNQDLKGPGPAVTRVTEAVAGRAPDAVGVDLMGQPVYRGAQVGVSNQPGGTMVRPGATRPDLMGRPVPVTPDSQVAVPGQQVPQYGKVPMRADGMGGTKPVAPVVGERTYVLQIGSTGPYSGVGVAPTEGTALPFEAIKKLRTLVGNEITDSGLASDVPRSKWKALYSALSSDLGTAAEKTGPDALKAWKRANDYTTAGLNRLDLMSGVVNQAIPERVFNAAVSGTKDGATMLQAVMKSVPDDAQRTVTAAFIKRMGQASPGLQNAEGDAFNMQTFLTNWSKLSPQARSALFSRANYPADFTSDLDRLSKITSNLRDGSKVLANPSGTSAALANVGAMGTALGALMSGNLKTAGAVAGTAVMSNVMSRAMASPAAVKWMLTLGTKPSSALPAAVNQFSQWAAKNGSPEDQALAKELGQQPQKADVRSALESAWRSVAGD